MKYFIRQKVEIVFTFSSEIFHQANLTNQNTLSCMCNSFMLSISVRQANSSRTPFSLERIRRRNRLVEICLKGSVR